MIICVWVEFVFDFLLANYSHGGQSQRRPADYDGDIIVHHKCVR